MKSLLFFLLTLLFFLPNLSFGATAQKVYLHVNKTEITAGDQIKIYGHVKPKKKNVKVRIFYKSSGDWAYLKTKTTKKKGRYHYHTTPEQDTYYRAKIKIKNKWTWGNKKQFVNVEPIESPIEPEPDPEPEPTPTDPFPACGEQYTWFNHDILAIGIYHSINPLGNVNPSGHTFPTDHMYYYLNSYLTVSDVYAPGDMYVESITAQEHLSEDPVFTDYTVRFRPCSEFYNFLMHMSGISANLQTVFDESTSVDNSCSEYSTGGQDYRICTREVEYFATTGEVIGTAGGNDGQYALDWGAYDTRTTISGVANQSRWYEQNLYNICPLDYYDTDNKNYLYTFLGYMAQKRTVEPLCGTIKQDVANTAQGRWFLSGTSGTSWQEDHQLALIHHNVDHAQGLFSVGDSVATLSTGTYSFTPTFTDKVNRDFDEVIADGSIYCYGTSTKVILIQLLTNTTLRIESQELGSCGSGPWSFSNYTDFER